MFKGGQRSKYTTSIGENSAGWIRPEWPVKTYLNYVLEVFL